MGTFVPVLCEKSRIIFPGGMCGGKNPSHGATCGKGPAPVGPGPFRAKAEREAPPAVPEGPRPSCRHAARGFPRPNVPRYIWANFL